MTNGLGFALLASITSGYGYIYFSYIWRYRFARENGYKLYLVAIAVGFIFLLIASGVFEITYCLTKLLSIEPIFVLSESVESLLIVMTSLLISCGVTIATNRLIPQYESMVRAWKNDDFDRICYEALNSLKPIAVTLESRKVYVGLITDTLAPDQERSHLTILPLHSGYRTKDELKFTLTRRYDVIFDYVLDDNEDHPELLADFQIAIPRNIIQTIHIFNDYLYDGELPSK
ncbi:hypothetical protein [Gilvimarinus sp. 1_MG-2023]|uniref:hypothetical protein n=1 Tax=Gilvimarinus sp. 1_MG-2023 TaxID=3062638 RepID=UPI0026E1DEEF|nr:hypothetical protein [Gilvimarinus sp. 1_MG-2023]MDO6747828.1 hypothetical protein [Gilvimarinus sp. 1_MG-2023]